MSALCKKKRLSLCGFREVLQLGGKLSLVISQIQEIIRLRSAYGSSGGELKN